MDVVRRSMVLAYVPADARFKPFGAYVPGGYIAGKYRRHGDDAMDESFFPVVWREDGYRTPFLADYCGDALMPSLAVLISVTIKSMNAVQTPMAWTLDQMAQFQSQGYLILDNLLVPDQIKQISDRFDPLFDTQFETGIYPDEWYGRPGLSQPNATRQMTGLWRCDRTLASYTLSREIARLSATLMGWNGARYGFDACWIKPPDAPTLPFIAITPLLLALIQPP